MWNGLGRLQLPERKLKVLGKEALPTKAFRPWSRTGENFAHTECNPSLCCLWNSGPERHRHRLGLRKTRAFKFFQPQICQYYWRISKVKFFFLIFLKKDKIRPQVVVTSRTSQEKIPSMQDLPIQSAIVTPKAGSIVELDDIEANVRFFSFPFCIVCVFRCLFFRVCVPSIWLYHTLTLTMLMFFSGLADKVCPSAAHATHASTSDHTILPYFHYLSLTGQRLCMEWRW